MKEKVRERESVYIWAVSCTTVHALQRLVTDPDSHFTQPSHWFMQTRLHINWEHCNS